MDFKHFSYLLLLFVTCRCSRKKTRWITEFFLSHCSFQSLKAISQSVCYRDLQRFETDTTPDTFMTETRKNGSRDESWDRDQVPKLHHCRLYSIWALHNNSERNLDLDTVWFWDLHCILKQNFWIGFDKHKSPHIWKILKVKIWGRLHWSQYANTTSDQDNVFKMYCAVMALQWKTKSQLYLRGKWNTWYSKCIITPWGVESGHSQNGKSAPILIITEAQKANLFVCKRTGLVNEMLKEFVKMTLTWVWSHWLWLESGHSVKNVTRVESP